MNFIEKLYMKNSTKKELAYRDIGEKISSVVDIVGSLNLKDTELSKKLIELMDCFMEKGNLLVHQ